MKIYKKLLSFLLSAVLVFGLFGISASACVDKTVRVSIMQHVGQNLTFEKPEEEQYKCAIINNKNKFISVSCGNEGGYYWLYVTAKKPTTYKSAKPRITVYKEKDGKKIILKRFEITVTPYEKITLSDVKLNKGMGVIKHIKHPYEPEYKFKYDSKIISINVYYSYDDYKIKALKNGTTTVKVYISGTEDLVSSFKVTVGDYAASIKSSYKNVSIKYNKHMSSLVLNGASFDLGQAINYYHTDATYSISISDKNVLASRKTSKTDLTPASYEIYSKKTGKATVTVYETRKNKAKKKIGTVTFEVKKAKDSEVFETNMEYDNDGIFYEFYISPGGKYDLKNTVINRYINYSLTGSKFGESDYSFEFFATPPEELTIDENGILTCVGYIQNAPNEVGYKVTFADGSSITQRGSINVCDPNEEY